MGEQISTPQLPLGPKSYNAEIKKQLNDLDYKDPRYDKQAKLELYELFMKDEIIHVSIAQELKSKYLSSLEECKILKNGLNTK